MRKPQREKIKGQERAIEVHNIVGREVRDAIGRIGCIVPRVELEDKDAKRLIRELEKNDS